VKAIMIHHLHGDGFAPVRGSADIRKLERIIDRYGDTLTYTFDDRLPCQELAVNLLDKKGIRGIFFVCHHNVMEMDRATRERMPDFYRWFMNEYPYPEPTIPDDFLSQYTFYSKKERTYRYIRDILNPIVHEEIMAPLRENVDLLCLDKIRHHEIGLHSYSHPARISRLSEKDQLFEYRENLKMIPEATTMSHPMGDYNETTLIILRALGITKGYRSDNRRGPTSLELPRIDINLLP